VSILSAKVNLVEVIFAEQSGPGTFRPQCNFQVNAIIDNNVQSVLKLLHLISITHYIQLLLLVRVEHPVSLHHLPHTLLILSECCVLRGYLRVILDDQLLRIVFEHLHIVIFEFGLIDGDDGPDGVGYDSELEGDRVALDLHEEGDADVLEDFGLQGDVHYLRGLRVDDSHLLVGGVDCDSLGLIVLGDDFILGFEVVVVDDLDAAGLWVAQETLIEFEEVGGEHTDFRD
jgi:hypothetical protein